MGYQRCIAKVKFLFWTVRCERIAIGMDKELNGPACKDHFKEWVERPKLPTPPPPRVVPKYAFAYFEKEYRDRR